MVKIAVLASFNMDLVMRTARQPRPGETLPGEFAMYLGGKGFNQAVAARRLGAEVTVIGRVGDDEFGRRFLEAVDREGIDRACVSVDPVAGTGVASIIVDDTGENAIVQAPQANTTLTYEAIVSSGPVVEEQGVAIPAPLQEADAFLATLETPVDVAELLAAIVYDLRRAAPLILNPAPASRIEPRPKYQWTHWILNAVECEHVTGVACSGPERALEAAGRLAEAENCTAVVSLGAHGAVTRELDTSIHVPAFAVDAIDTVGAGDAFCAAFAVATAEGADLADAVRFANAAGAVATTRHGAEPSMPRRDEVEALLAKGATR